MGHTQGCEMRDADLETIKLPFSGHQWWGPLGIMYSIFSFCSGMSYEIFLPKMGWFYIIMMSGITIFHVFDIYDHCTTNRWELKCKCNK